MRRKFSDTILDVYILVRVYAAPIYTAHALGEERAVERGLAAPAAI